MGIASHSPSSSRSLGLTEQTRAISSTLVYTAKFRARLTLNLGVVEDSLIHAATASWPRAVAPCLNLCTGLVNKMDHSL